MVGGDTTIVGDEGRPRTRSGPGLELPALARGDEVGRYVVLHQLGRGGMGVVYAAFDPQLDRKVALKVLHHGAKRREASEGQPRLLREAQALAKLSHPNVVAVHDVGLHGDDVFIAMEFVSGETLGSWASAASSWREVVSVLVAAGRGLAAAHRAGIVHRDFKPENVMLDGEGRPRVLDFGLARAAREGGATAALGEGSLEWQLSAGTLSTKLTQTGALMGTPAYMAPEQYAGAEVDARTDQFAFCVSAYEALYGERPFGGDSVAAVAFAIHEGRVREAPRDTPVPGWLRKVIVRGLAHDAQARWPSMDALLEAMGRDPVRRRRRVIGGLALVLAVGVLGAVAQRSFNAGPQLCSDAAAHLEGVWDADAHTAVEAAFAATGQRHASASALAVAAQLDSYAAAWVEQRTQACAATRIHGEQSDEVLSLRMACLDRGLAQLDGLVRMYREADAEIVNGAVDAIAALPSLASCGDIEGLIIGVRPPDDADERARSEALRAQLDRARSLELAGKRSEATSLLAALEPELLALAYRPLVAEFSLAYGPMLDAPKARVEQLERAAWMAEASRHDRVSAHAWIELVNTYAAFANDFPLAHMALQRADAAIARLAHGGEEDEDLRVRLLVAHAKLRKVQGEVEQALVLLREARERREALGEGVTPAALDELVTLSNVMMYFGDHAGAEPLLREALAQSEAVYGSEHPWGARLRSTLARVHYMSEDYAAAEQALLDALRVTEQAFGVESMTATGILNGLALVRTGAGDEQGALAAYARALEIAERVEVGDNLHTAGIHLNCASLERALGRPEQALGHVEAALEILRKVHGAQSPELFSQREELGLLLLDTGDMQRAALELGSLLQAREAVEGPQSPALAALLEGLARVDVAEGRPDAAAAKRTRAAGLRASVDAGGSDSEPVDARAPDPHD